MYAGIPLLLIPALTLIQAKWSPQGIYLFVAAFGAMGHPLPGMIRAYGDRALEAGENLRVAKAADAESFPTAHR